MKVGIIGLGGMGSGIAARLLKENILVYGWDIDHQKRKHGHNQGLTAVSSLKELVELTTVVWLSLPAGVATHTTLEEIAKYVRLQQIIVDSGNSQFQDAPQYAELFKQKGASFIDVGISGGIHGRERGYCLMLGGDSESVERLALVCGALAMPGGIVHVGPSGAGHYAKMVHNGIEYALLEAYAEGMSLLKEGAYKDLPLAAIAQAWQHGSIISSSILSLYTQVLVIYPNTLPAGVGPIGETGMGKWMIDEAHRQQLRAEVIEASVRVREWSRKTGGDYGTGLVALLRTAFGGHSPIP